MLQIKPSSYHKDCYDISYPDYSASAVIWLEEGKTILEEAEISFNIEELEQIIAFMKSLEKETGK